MLSLNRSKLGADRGLFLLPELTSAEGFADMKRECAAKSEAYVNEAMSEDRTRIVAREHERPSGYFIAF